MYSIQFFIVYAKRVEKTAEIKNFQIARPSWKRRFRRRFAKGFYACFPNRVGVCILESLRSTSTFCLVESSWNCA